MPKQSFEQYKQARIMIFDEVWKDKTHCVSVTPSIPKLKHRSRTQDILPSQTAVRSKLQLFYAAFLPGCSWPVVHLFWVFRWLCFVLSNPFWIFQYFLSISLVSTREGIDQSEETSSSTHTRDEITAIFQYLLIESKEEHVREEREWWAGYIVSEL